MRFGIVDSMDCAHHLVGTGICEQPHGHTYRIEALFRAGSRGEAGAALRQVMAAYDHKDLNTILEFPSCENLCTRMAHEIMGLNAGLMLLKVWEGEGKWAEWDKVDLGA